MGKFCKFVIGLLFFFYLIALGIFAVLKWGLFGVTTDPLAGLFLAPMGLPWNVLVDVESLNLRILIGVLSPMINLAIVYLLCRAFRRPKHTGVD